jgi:anti-sigma regulatory factor (Ser/Thr protein kinase)
MRHGAFVYEDDDRMLGTLAPWLNAGLADGEPVVVVLERTKWEQLAGALGSGADAISRFSSDVFLARPETALAGFDGVFRRLMRDGASGLRVYGEPPWRAEAEWNAWISFEAIFNRAFAHQRGWVMCGYDARKVPEPALLGAFETHPEVLTEDWARSPHYHDPEEVVRSHTPTPVPLTGLHALPLDDGTRGFRENLRAELEAGGVSKLDTKSMLIAAGEVLANAQRHGGERVSVSVGRVDGRFVCEVSDDGPGFDDPLAGFLPPRPGHTHGTGLWVARQLTQELELVPSPHGMTVRLWV